MFHGVNFPANGPIMGERTIGWDPSFQKMTVSNNILRGDVTMFLQLKGGGYYSCQFHTSYKYIFCFCNSSNVGISFLLSIWISSSVFYGIKTTEENAEIKRALTERLYTNFPYQWNFWDRIRFFTRYLRLSIVISFKA